MKTGTLLAIALLLLVALAHALRVIMGTAVVIENWQVPILISVLGVIVPVGIATLLFRESKNSH